MAKRFKMSRAGSQRHFTRNAMRVNGKNYAMPMRGGIRL